MRKCLLSEGIAPCGLRVAFKATRELEFNMPASELRYRFSLMIMYVEFSLKGCVFLES